MSESYDIAVLVLSQVLKRGTQSFPSGSDLIPSQDTSANEIDTTYPSKNSYIPGEFRIALLNRCSSNIDCRSISTANLFNIQLIEHHVIQVAESFFH